MKFSQKKVDAVTALPGAERYSHFVKVAADLRAVWGLYHSGWALVLDADGRPFFPIWPAAPYAAQCAISEWEGYQPRQIELDDFLEQLLPQLRQSNTGVAVFLTPTEQGTTPALEVIEADLRSELSRIE